MSLQSTLVGRFTVTPVDNLCEIENNKMQLVHYEFIPLQMLIMYNSTYVYFLCKIYYYTVCVIKEIKMLDVIVLKITR